MGMGIVTDADFDAERRNSNVPTQRREETVGRISPLPTPGRNKGDVNVPNSLRKIIGDTATSEGRQEALALAKNFGISDSSASAYAHGSNSTSSYNDRPNLPVINGAKERIQKRARIKLQVALKALTPEKIGESKAIEIAGIAKAMSAIVKDMEPEVPDADREKLGRGPTFVFMAPPTLKEEIFDVKYVKE